MKKLRTEWRTERHSQPTSQPGNQPAKKPNTGHSSQPTNQKEQMKTKSGKVGKRKHNFIYFLNENKNTRRFSLFASNLCLPLLGFCVCGLLTVIVIVVAVRYCCLSLHLSLHLHLWQVAPLDGPVGVGLCFSLCLHFTWFQHLPRQPVGSNDTMTQWQNKPNFVTFHSSISLVCCQCINNKKTHLPLLSYYPIYLSYFIFKLFN